MRLPWRALLALTFASYIAFFGWMTLQRYYQFGEFPYDFGIFSQSVATVARHFLPAWNAFECMSHFAVHNQPVLYLLAVPYALSGYRPESLLAIQTLALALASLAIYKLAKEKGLGAEASTALALSYLLNPAVHGINLFDFHPVSLGPLFILLTFYFLEKNSLLAIPFALLTLSLKEDAGLALVGMGLYSLTKRRWARGLTLLVVGVAWAYLSILIIKSFNPYHVYSQQSAVNLKYVRYALDKKLLYTALLLASVAFLPLLRPSAFLLVLPALAETFLAGHAKWTMWQFGYHYPYMSVPLLYAGACLALEKHERLWKLLVPATLAVLFLVPVSPMIGPLIKVREILFSKFAFLKALDQVRFFWTFPREVTYQDRLMWSFAHKLSELPDTVPVVFSPLVAATLSNRLGTYWPPCLNPKAWAAVMYVLDSSSVRWWKFNVRYLERLGFKMVYYYDGIALFTKNPYAEKLFEAMLPKKVNVWGFAFNNEELKGKPAFVYPAGSTQEYWGGSSPWPLKVKVDHFSVALCTGLKGPFELKGTLKADDGAALFVDGKLVVNCFWAPLCSKGVNVRLGEGYHTIVIFYRDSIGRAYVELLVNGKPLSSVLEPPSRGACWKLVSALREKYSYVVSKGPK